MDCCNPAGSALTEAGSLLGAQASERTLLGGRQRNKELNLAFVSEI